MTAMLQIEIDATGGPAPGEASQHRSFPRERDQPVAPVDQPVGAE